MAVKRIRKELQDLEKDPSEYFVASATADNVFKWQAAIIGPEHSPYAGGTFFLDIDIPTSYPFQAPKIAFTTKLFHPNVNSRGQTCHDLGPWSPAMTLRKLIECHYYLLADPNPHDPLDIEAAKMYNTDRANFDKIAREWTDKYAK